MSRTDAFVQNLEYKLKKRGFARDPYPKSCRACKERAVFVYALPHTNIGGRTIEWCHHCHIERGYSRDADGERIEDTSFELEAFLA